ncbi:MAG: hypothetical protein ACK5L5_12310 [Bacteroidales bacterium]
MISVIQVFKQKDKQKHLAVGFIISLLIGVFAPLWGFGIAMITGAIKEWIWDRSGRGTVDVLDFVFTALGALVALVINLIW